jgi:arginine/serine-rich splicing factor 7
MSRGRDRSYDEEDKRDKRDNPQIYVGRLPRGLYERDLEDIFAKFGKIKSLLMKRGFAFIVGSNF